MTVQTTNVLESPRALAQDKIRGHKFCPPAEVLATIPQRNTTDQPLQKQIVHLHFFLASADWYVTEYDPQTGIAFGWAELFAGCGEWGYFSLVELAETNAKIIGVERDLDWTPTIVSLIERIK